MADLNRTTISHKGGKLRRYTMAFKSEAIEYAEEVSNRAAAAKYKIDVKRIREWRKVKDSVVELEQKSKRLARSRLEGGGRRVLQDDLDELLLDWIHGRRANGLRVPRKLVMRKAKQMYDEKCHESEKDLF